MSTTLAEKISNWADTLPKWEKATLQKLVSQGEISNEDYRELLQLLLVEAGLADSPAQPIQPRPAEAYATAASTESPKRLKRIFGVQNVNALASDQELCFAPNLTVIYGNNGSGKSGYARIIANASFTRGDSQVLTDVNRPYDPDGKQFVSFEFEGDAGSVIVEHELGTPCPQMDMFHVFDSTSARVHLSKQNTLSFAPTGLQFLTQMAAATDQVRTLLDQEIRKRQRPNTFTTYFREDSPIKATISQLGAATNLSELRRLGDFSSEDATRLTQLDASILRIASQDVEEQIRDNQQIVDDLRSLMARLTDIEALFSTSRLVQLSEQIAAWQDRWRLLQSASQSQISNLSSEQAGAERWFRFITAAHDLVADGGLDDVDYPTESDACLFCGQSLSESARQRITGLWTLIQNDVHNGLTQLEQELDGRVRDYASLQLDFFDEQQVSYRHLEAYDESILAEIAAFLGACSRVRKELVDALSRKVSKAISLATAAPLEKLANTISQLEERLVRLQSSDLQGRLAQLQAERAMLRHRQQLGRLLPEIVRYVEDAKWIATAEQPSVRRNTRHISMQYDRLFNEVVTTRYKELLEEHLGLLNFPAKITVETRTSKGETYKQLALHRDDSVPPRVAQAEKVLSEGEQKAVALADFLTEVVLDEKCTGIVLDDPVTSLDFGWKDHIAPILVKHAVQQQVVIFTHDLHFLYCLKEAADKHPELVVSAHWIEKRDGVPGWVFQDNSPLSEKDHKTSRVAQEHLARALKAPPMLQQTMLQAGFGALRTCYEAFVIFDLLGNVVVRFGERISIDRLRDVHIDQAIRDQVIDKVGFLSRYIEGHLHSDQYIAQKPTPELLRKEIEEFDDIRKRHREYKKMASG